MRLEFGWESCGELRLNVIAACNALLNCVRSLYRLYQPLSPRVQANQLMDRVSVINGGELIQKNLWVDNCFTT